MDNLKKKYSKNINTDKEFKCALIEYLKSLPKEKLKEIMKSDLIDV